MGMYPVYAFFCSFMADDTVVVHSLLRILFTKYEYVRILTEACAYKLPWYEADINMKDLGIKSIKNKKFDFRKGV